ncbi:MAG: cytochrome b [bacterium]|nr:cytochrome b [Gammaproteobacteria bacterium]HIL94377.1 cytochrome b [Pseudomonadales bacterium]
MFDSATRFGLVTLLFHWVTALTIIGLFILGLYMVELTYYDALYNKLPFIHKSIGILLCGLLLLRLIWKPFNPALIPLTSHRSFEILGAKLAHWMLYLLTVVIVISGYLIPTSGGSGISVFDWFSVPATITTIPEQEDLAGLIHKITAYLVIGVTLVHAGAALKHHFVDRDDTLRRMLGVKPR